MRDIELYAQILGLRAPWEVTRVDLEKSSCNVVVHVSPAADTAFVCPTCNQPATGYDRRARRWRHLDTCQYTTTLEALVPRVSCPVHGVLTVAVPWAEPGSGFTQLFEALVIDWLKEASIQAVSRQLRVSWSSIDRIMARAVARGMARRGTLHPTRLCVDETSFQKRHEYVTVVTDPDAGRVETLVGLGVALPAATDAFSRTHHQAPSVGRAQRHRPEPAQRPRRKHEQPHPAHQTTGLRLP